LLDIIGSNLPEVLNNLDNMHIRVALAFPDLRPPSFWCSVLEFNRRTTPFGQCSGRLFCGVSGQRGDPEGPDAGR
jgi:hypothetical protein